VTPPTHAPRATRTVLDVSELPDTAFGSRDIVWWGTLGFVVIEGFTLALCAVVYLYLMQNADAWPPTGTLEPSLGVPTVQAVAMLLSLPLAVWMGRVARRCDLAKTRIALTAGTLVCAVLLTLRLVELIGSLNVQWDTNAYGSAQWLVVVSHGTLLLFQFVEIAGIAIAFWFASLEQKHFSDAADAAFYWIFMVLAWPPLYVLCFLVPRWV
jgi:heme/copper-type cytochrome/quinol oxidase subunit 3